MSRPRLVAFLALILLTVATPPASAVEKTAAVKSAGDRAGDKIVAGWVENVYIADLDTKLKAKLDTGATTSSMRAEVLNVVHVENGAPRRVVFQVTGADGKTSTLERRLLRWVRIKSKKTSTYYRRPVVDMEFCIAGRRVHSEVNLAPRTDFIYPILVGRNMLRDANIVVDADRTFTTHAHCPDVPSQSSLLQNKSE